MHQKNVKNSFEFLKVLLQNHQNWNKGIYVNLFLADIIEKNSTIRNAMIINSLRRMHDNRKNIPTK